MSSENLSRLHVVVEGHVQGVGFRYFVQEAAISQDLTGWVRNRWDGSVEVLAEGARENLGRLLTALQRGPRASYVSAVRPIWQEYGGEFTDFQVLPTD